MSSPKIVTASLQILSSLAPDPLAVLASTVVVAAACLLGLGLLRRSDPATAFATGMGAGVLLLTILGVAGLGLRPGLAVLGGAALVAGWLRRAEAARWLRPTATVLLLLLPLLLLLSDRRGSEWDEFSHWLHAFRYLATHYRLPGAPDAPAIASCCAAYPYAWPMVGAAAMAVTGFSEAVPGLLNTLVLGLFALLLGQLAAEGAGQERPRPGLWAAAVLFATLLAPSFVHKLAFSAYADIVTAFLVATLALAGERLAAAARNEDGWRRALAFGLIGGTLLAVKPGNAGLFACTLGAALVIALRCYGWRGLVRAEWLLAILLPLAFSALWRWHVDRYLAGQEMGLRPFKDWNIHLIPAIVKAMASVASQKGGHFGLGLAVAALGLAGLVRCRGRLDRLAALAGMLFVGYNLFLLTTYVAVFGDQDGLNVMSFWRYNTHVGLAVMLPVALLAGHLLRRHGGHRWMSTLGAVAIATALAGPLAAAGYIRFDRDPMKVFYRETLRQLLTIVPPGAAVAVFDPQGSGLSRVMAVYEWDNQLTLGGGLSAFDGTPPAQWLETRPAPWAILLSRPDLAGLGPADGAVLAHRTHDGWTAVERFPYPGRQPPDRWP